MKKLRGGWNFWVHKTLPEVNSLAAKLNVLFIHWINEDNFNHLEAGGWTVYVCIDGSMVNSGKVQWEFGQKMVGTSSSSFGLREQVFLTSLLCWWPWWCCWKDVLWNTSVALESLKWEWTAWHKCCFLHQCQYWTSTAVTPQITSLDTMKFTHLAEKKKKQNALGGVLQVMHTNRRLPPHLLELLCLVVYKQP